MRNRTNNQYGTTLIEGIIAIGIFVVVTTGLYLLIQLGIRVVRDSQSRLDALAIAESQMESIKNLPYDNIGTNGGIPAGNITQTSTQTQNDIEFTVETDIRYVDDPFDGTAPIDLVSTDYKSIRVEVRWADQLITAPVVLITIISPNGIETDVGGGTLWLEVFNASAQPIPNATVRITNNTIAPAINITTLTDSNGRFILPGADPAVESYHVEISKSGYSSSQTYVVDALTNPNPDPTDITVIEDEVTTKTFTIDLLSDLQFYVEQRDTGEPIEGLTFTMTGDKRIGTQTDGSDIPKYAQQHTTDSSGNTTVSNIEYDTYSISIDPATTGYDFAGSAPHLPYVLGPNANETITIHVMPDTPYTLLLTVENATGVAITNATVRAYNSGLSIDSTETTNAAGQVFFTALNNESFTIEVTADGYQPYTASVNVTGDDIQTIPLTAL